MIPKFSSLYLALVVTFLCSLPSLQAQSNYALDFDGTNDYVDLGTPISAGSNYSIEAWVNASIVTGARNIVSSRDAPFWIANGTLSAGVGGNYSMVTNPSFPNNEWVHVAVTFDDANNTMSLYQNGILVDENLGAVGSVALTPIYIGAHVQAAPGYEPISFFNGKISEVRIWDDVRSKAEIQANMFKQLAGSEGNLIAYYPMTEGTGTSLSDQSTNSNTGNITNGPLWKASGAFASGHQAIHFDGDNDYISIPQSTVVGFAANDFTIETWLKRSSDLDRMDMFNHRGTGKDLGFFINGSDQVQLFCGTSSGTQNLTSLTTVGTEWTHVAGVRSGSTLSIYINGVLDNSTSAGTKRDMSSTQQFVIGANFNGSPYSHFHGNIDEFRMWNSARTEAEVKANMYRSLEGDETDLVAYFRFDQQADASNTSVYDMTSNGNHGTLTNMDAASDWVASNHYNTWIGTDDGDWDNADNWSLGSVPAGEYLGIYDWSGSIAPSSGTISAQELYIGTGVSISHAGDLTISEDFWNEGTFETSGRVTFSGSTAQTIKGGGSTSFGSWTVNNAAGLTLESGLTITSSLTLSAGVVDLNSQTLTINSAASLSGVPGASNHVDATSGTLRKIYSGTGSFTYPVGDGTNYTPISLDFTSGTFASAYTDISLSTSKHPSNTSGSHFLRRYWTASSSGISDFSCDVSATYVDGDINGTESELYGGKWSSGWILLDPVNTATNEISGTISSFSDFTAGEAAAFPVEWISFEAESTPESVDLTWATASESNSHYFGVERSNDLGTWTEIGQVEAAGFSTQESHYLFTDLFPTSGENFYRLRQVDFDGRMDYSEVRSVWMNESLKLYPNPVRETLNLDLPAGDWHATIFDQQGREVRSISQVGSTIDMERMPAGVYYLILENGQGQRMSERVIRQ